MSEAFSRVSGKQIEEISRYPLSGYPLLLFAAALLMNTVEHFLTRVPSSVEARKTQKCNCAFNNLIIDNRKY